MVTPSFYPIEGGTETMVRNLSIELKNTGLDVDVLTFNMDKKWAPKWRGTTEKIDGISVFKVPGLNWLPINHSPRITSKVDVIPGRFTHIMKNYDVIHFHESEFSFPLFSYFVKKPKILHLHGIDCKFFKQYHFSRLFLKNSANLYISLTNTMKADLISLGICKDKIKCLPNSVDTQIYKPDGERTDNTLLFVGRVVPGKGLHILLKALKHVITSVTLNIVGPMGWDDNYNQNILHMIELENKRGKHNINYLGGVDPNDSRLIDLYQHSSVFVLPSFYEAFGVVILEAMACGTPVVSTQTGGTPEIIENQKNGLLVPVNNCIKLADAINYLLDNPDIRLKLGKMGLKTVEKNFSIKTVIKRLCNIYDDFVQ